MSVQIPTETDRCEHARLDATLHAFVHILPEPVAPRPGPFGGMPFAVKDLCDIAGRAPTLGLAHAPNAAPETTAAVIEVLAAQGACLIGFTKMTALAYEPSGGNTAQGRPVNPWDASAICGGSSSGSAVAVAAGIVPLALGSDTAGSLRIPAQCCGVTAWKPTHGLVPVAGTMALAPSLDCIGFLAGAAKDIIPVAAAFMATGADDFPAIRKIAVARDVLADCDADIVHAMAQVEAALRLDGIACGDTALNNLIAACDAPVLVLLQGEAALAHKALLESGHLDPVLGTRLAKGSAITPAQMHAARTTLAELAGAALDAVFGDAGAILLPVMRIRTPSVAACEPGSPLFSARTLYALSALTRWVNGLRLPTVAIPAGFDSAGLPLAVQIVARPHGDRALLDVAARLQVHTDWHGRVPTGITGLVGESA